MHGILIIHFNHDCNISILKIDWLTSIQSAIFNGFLIGILTSFLTTMNFVPENKEPDALQLMQLAWFENPEQMMTPFLQPH